MRTTGLLILAAVVTVTVVVIVGMLVLQPPQSLIRHAAFSETTISPNADGEADITRFAYGISRNATVSLSFTGDDATYFFREDETRVREDYEVLFSGVVDGYTLPGEDIQGAVLRRLMPDGEYTWELSATDESGDAETRTGTLIIDGGDAALPEISAFTVSPEAFSPNQDGIRDRAQINVYLEKAADLQVWLEAENGARTFIPARNEGREAGEPGRHLYDYAGGVDQGADPPPDGTYTVVALARDAEGQEIERRATLSLSDGGKPLAEIAAQPSGVEVVFDVVPYDGAYASDADVIGAPVEMPTDPQALDLSDITMEVGAVLVFRLTVENYSDTPIRTHGAPPGTVYDQTQRGASLGTFDQSGAWRVGIDCDTATSDYPWRWAVGDESVLEAVYDPRDDNTYYYLPPGEQAVVWGGIRMTELVEQRNPQNCWAGLIHEDVEISLRNRNVGTRSIELVDADARLYVDEGE